MNCKAECTDCKAHRCGNPWAWEKEEQKTERRKRNGGSGYSLQVPTTFRRPMIFKLSAPAYDARVKSSGVDFREWEHGKKDS